MKLSIEKLAELAEVVYFAVIGQLGNESKYVEPDPDNNDGTRNTEEGVVLYSAIESSIEEALNEGGDDSETESTVTLNSFDDEGNVVDTTAMQLSNNQIIDIIDHAAQFVIVFESLGNNVNAEQAEQVLANLKEALEVSGVL